MKPIEKTADDLFQKLRNRFDPVEMGDENAEQTTDPKEARIFSFMYKDGENEVGFVSISIVANRSFKVYYGTDVADRVENKTNWYNFLRDLRMFAKRNLMSFDARDLAKNQLEPRDFKFISNQDGTYKEHEVAVSESVMFGSRRKSYQTMENVKMIVHHRKSIDETIPGSRSRYIESIYLERADGERYKFPYNYLTGARAMARHVNEGGNPYDDTGKHIIEMIKEMRDLSKFARRTKKYAMEDEAASGIRNNVVERFQSMKKQLGAMSVKEGYARFVENFKTEEALSEDETQQLKERFTQQVFDTQLEDTLPAVMRAIKEAEMRQVAEADKSIVHLIKSKPLVLRKDDSADQMFRSTKFTDGAGLLGFILSDVASRAIGDDADVIANFASDAAERMQDRDYDPSDKQTAMMLAKKYMDDVKKMASDPDYGSQIRVDPKEVYGGKKKRSGGFHETEEYESWANAIVPEDYEKDAADASKKYGAYAKHEKALSKSDSLAAQLSPLYRKDMDDRSKQSAKISKRYAKKATTGMDDEQVPESSFYRDDERTGSAEGAKRAILWRIQNQHLDLIKQYGLDAVLQAVDDEAMYLDNLEEIGSSDISAWVNNIKRNLAADYTEVAANMEEDQVNELSLYKMQAIEKEASKRNKDMSDPKGIKHQVYGAEVAGERIKKKAGTYWPSTVQKVVDKVGDKLKGRAMTDYNKNYSSKKDKNFNKIDFGESTSSNIEYATGMLMNSLANKKKPPYVDDHMMADIKQIYDYISKSKDPTAGTNAMAGMNKNDVLSSLTAILKLSDQAKANPAVVDKLMNIFKRTNDFVKTSLHRDVAREAVTTGTVGTSGTSGTSTNPAQVMRDPKLQQAAKSVSRVGQAAGLKVNPNQVAQTLAGQQLGKAPSPKDKTMASDFGNKITALASDPKNAAKLQTLMKQMVVQGKFDESAVRNLLSKK